jgi:5-methylcytosine-specific restriction endonuclease McrA
VDVNRRKELSKKTRFEVFKRDAFRCQYCGQTPPTVILELDHIGPIAGGGNEETHLALM